MYYLPLLLLPLFTDGCMVKSSSSLVLAGEGTSAAVAHTEGAPTQLRSIYLPTDPQPKRCACVSACVRACPAECCQPTDGTPGSLSLSFFLSHSYSLLLPLSIANQAGMGAGMGWAGLAQTCQLMHCIQNKWLGAFCLVVPVLFCLQHDQQPQEKQHSLSLVPFTGTEQLYFCRSSLSKASFTTLAKLSYIRLPCLQQDCP